MPAKMWILARTMAVAAIVVVGACSGGDVTGSASERSEPTPKPADAGPDRQSDDQTDAESDATPGSPTPAPAPEGTAEPVPFQPSSRIGDPEAYRALIDELANELPAGLRDQAPWPDLQAADPVDAQLDIFDFWIWMAANRPEPSLAAAMAAEGSPSREELTAIFGGYKRDGELHRREGDPYVADDHRVVTFASADLPLWLAREVPADAVVVYYRDRSGPTTVRDDTTGEIIATYAAVPTRQWLSIMVPTEVGWLLYRDQLIEVGDTELEVPDLAPPSPDAGRRTPEV